MPVAAERAIELRVRRQDGPAAPPYWQSFRVPWKPHHNVVSTLMEIRLDPVTAEGRRVAPPAWEASCLEEVCGSCAMRINGRVRMACTALIDQLKQPITLEPLAKFPVVRDLIVDRSRMFEALKRVKAWIPVDGTYDLGPGPKQFPQVQEQRYPLSNCISCCCCMEVCPQFNVSTNFVGAATIGQAKLFNMDPSGAVLKEDRLRALAGDGGIQECGFAQNCVQACPKQLPLTEAISDIGRDVFVQQVKDLFSR